LDWESGRDHVPPLRFGYRLGSQGPRADALKDHGQPAATLPGASDICSELSWLKSMGGITSLTC
jgi:hypothetical protein